MSSKSRWCAVTAAICSAGAAACAPQASSPETAAPLTSNASPPAPPEVWQRVPMVGDKLLGEGFIGGEGAQWPRDIVISRSNPELLLLGIDVAGIYRSRDGGKLWQITMAGYHARGTNALAIDPVNDERVLAVSGNSTDWKDVNGLYLSTDGAASWKHVLPRHEGFDDRDSIAYDPSSCDQDARICKVAYFLSRDDGLFKTTDGGESWAVVSHSFGQVKQDLGGHLRVHPTKGFVYVVGHQGVVTGFFRSTDGGKRFDKILNEPVFGIDVVWTQPDEVYLSVTGGLRVSSDSGDSFRRVDGEGISKQNGLRDLRVSPVDPTRMLAWWTPGAAWEGDRVSSHDGGRSWQKARWDASRSFLPWNNRNGIWAWHPTDANVVFGIGGDFATRSTDGGRSFEWWSNGETAVMVGGGFNFNPHEPDALGLAFQDYNGALSRDGGRSWSYANISGETWGGHGYGGFALDATTMWAGHAKDWGAPRELKISFDAGRTWSPARGSDGEEILLSGSDVGMADPADPSIGFAGEYRSVDKGRTWQRMAGCDGVYGYDPSSRALVGRHAEDIVVSSDHGVSWKRVARIRGGFQDVAYDPVRRIYWVASEDRLKRVEGGAEAVVETPPDQFGARRVRSVAVDPFDPAIVYIGSHRDIYTLDNSVMRSLDAGKTWENLADPAALASAEDAGTPHEVSWLRVHPVTRELWAAGQCFGVWKLVAPAISR